MSWRCFSRPGGGTCGYVNALGNFCSSCGRTKHASNLRLAAFDIDGPFNHRGNARADYEIMRARTLASLRGASPLDVQRAVESLR